MEDKEFSEEVESKKEYVEKKVEPIYEGEVAEGNPILGPIAEMEQSFVNTQKLLDKSDWEYGQSKKEIEGMLEIMPKYSQTMIMAIIQKLIIHTDQSQFLERRQQEILKKGMQDMIKIAKEQYNKSELEQSGEDFDFAPEEPKESEEYQDESGFVSVDKDSE